MDRVISQADGILAGSPEVGEALELAGPTRRRLLAALLTAVAGRVPLFFGITGHSLEETRDLALALQEECRRGQLCRLRLSGGPAPVVPQQPGAAPGLPASPGGGPPAPAASQPAAVDRPAGPRLKRRNIRTHVFKKLAALPGVVGLIHQGEMRRFLNYHYAAAMPVGLRLLRGG